MKRKNLLLTTTLVIVFSLAIAGVGCRKTNKENVNKAEIVTQEETKSADLVKNSVTGTDVSKVESSVTNSADSTKNTEKSTDADSKEVATKALTEGNTDYLFTGNSKDAVSEQGNTDNEDTEVNGNTSSEPETEAVKEAVKEVATEASTEPPHVHNFEPIKETVHHDAVTHTEQVWVVDKAAWDEYELVKYSVCNECGARGSVSEMHNHWSDSRKKYIAGEITAEEVCGSSHNEYVYELKAHHPEEGHYETKTVTDKEAFDEEVVTGYKCACGEAKSA